MAFPGFEHGMGGHLPDGGGDNAIAGLTNFVRQFTNPQQNESPYSPDMASANNDLCRQGILPNFGIGGMDGGQDSSAGIPPQDQLMGNAFNVGLSQNNDGSYNVNSPMLDGNAANLTMNMFDTMLADTFGMGQQQQPGADGGTDGAPPPNPLAAFGMNSFEAQAWGGFPDTPDDQSEDD